MCAVASELATGIRIETQGCRASLDGDSTNGRESLVIGLRPGRGRDNELQTVGFFCLEPDAGENYRITKVFTGDAIWPYNDIYAKIVVLDRNKDGFDDIIVYLLKDAAHSQGDLIYSQNVGHATGFGDSRFAYQSPYYEVSWPDDSFERDLKLADADNDGVKELIAGLPRRDPPDDPNGTYKIFYYDIFNDDATTASVGAALN